MWLAALAVQRDRSKCRCLLLIEPGEIGDPALLDQCLIRIDKPRKALYQHEQFRVGNFALVCDKKKCLPWEVLIDQALQARFEARRQAQRYMDFMQGKRFTLVELDQMPDA
jgi:hypothetical protein